MSSYVHLSIELHQDETFAKDLLDAERKEPKAFAQNMIKLFSGLASGSFNGRVATMIENAGGTQATWTIACTQANAAGNIVTIAGVVFTEAVDFVRGADDTATGANLAAAINANIAAGGDLAGLFTSAGAAAVTGTITLIALAKSVAGRQITITTDDATAFAITNTVTGATGTLKRGARAYNFGESV